MKILKNILVVIIIVVVFFCALEVVQRVRYAVKFNSNYWLGFGFVDKPEKYREMMDPPVKSIEVAYMQQDGYIKNNPEYTKYKINSRGFRGKEFNIKKEKGIYRVVVLGGSTTFCTYAEDDTTYPEYLEKKTGFEVINAGVPSANIWEIKHLFKKEILALEPDMIIISSILNNLYYYAPHCLHRTGGLINNINRCLLNRSLFYVTLREKISLIINGDATYVWFPPLHNAANSFMNYEVFWERFKKEYRDIVHISKQHNIEVVILRQPILLRKGYGILFDETMLPVYKRIYAFFDTLGVRVLDAASYFNAYPEKEKLFVDDGLHLTATGNEYLASIIATEIKPEEKQRERTAITSLIYD